MGKKLEGNGLWETSRMMLPEPKEKIIQAGYRNDNYRGVEPELDTQEWESILEIMRSSLRNTESIQLKLYDPYEVLIVEGIIEKFDPLEGWFQVNGDRFQFSKIISAIDA